MANMQVSCTAGGKPLILQNPVMTAPGGFGNVVEYRELVDLEKLGALIPNSMLSDDGAPSRGNKFQQTPCGYLSAFGPNNIGLQTFIKEALPLLPQDGPPLIVDLKARSIEEMEALVELAADTSGIAAIEVNLNCPYATGEPLYWRDPAQLDRLMRSVKARAGGKPVIAKAPGGFYPMAEMARVLENAGTDLFVPFNAIDGCAIDIRSRTVQGGGYFGPGIKPFALSRCREAASVFHIPVIGAGGITCAADVVEYILAGAFAVQVGSACLTRPDFLTGLLEELEELLEELGISSLDDIRGTAAPRDLHLFS